MYTQKQVEDVLSQVEQEFEKAFESVKKSEITEEVEVEASAEEVTEDSLDKNEEIEEDNYETIEDLYSSMEKSEIEAHYASIKKVMFDGSDENEEQALDKSEEQNENAEEEQTLSKAEEELNKFKSENEELKKSYEQLNSLVEQMLNNSKKAAPTGKAITSSNYIAKSEEESEEEDLSSLSKSEISKKLNAIDFATLEKSDRKAINEYYLENGSVDKIKHLITK